MKYLLLSILVVSLVNIMIIPNILGQEDKIPDWIKNNAGWWATDQIDDSSFLQGIQYLIKEGIMVIPSTETAKSTGSQGVPSWIKNNAGWWAESQIDDSSFVLGIQWLISNGIIIVEEKLKSTDADFRVAFIGDQDIGLNAIAVLNLIKDERTQMVLHQGDLDYEEDPDAWDKMISDVLGDDFPYFVSIGAHDVVKWDEYQQKLDDRLKKIPDAKCMGDLGVKSSCSYKGLFFIQVGPDLKGSGHSSFIENQLNNNDHIWSVCSWGKVMHYMQLGQKEDTVGWEVYENCKTGGAIIATGHEHSYHRTKTLIDIENQIVDPEWSEPNKLRVKEGSTFVFVSGLGGQSIRDQDRCLPGSYPYGCNGEWASIYTSDQDANYGALFCTFNVGEQPNKAYCYFKDIDGRIIDEFTVTSFLGTYPDNTDLIDVDMSGRDLTGDDFSNTVIIDSNLSNVILIGADLSNAVLIGTSLTGADLTDANLTGVSLAYKDLTGTILRGADLTDANLTGVDLSGRDLTGTILRGMDLTDKDLTGTILTGANLSNSILTDVNLSGKDLTGTILRGMDLTDKDLTGTILRGADLTDANLTGFDLSGRDLTGTILRGADLTDANLTGVDLSGRDLTGTILRGMDLTDKDLTGTILRGADLTNAILPSGYLSGNNFKRTIFNGVDLSGKDLSKSNFESASFKNTNLKNANIRKTQFLDADLSGANLAGADLSIALLSFSNLSGVNLSGAILDRNNFSVANLSGLDFTVISNATVLGSVYQLADLSNANFEDVNLYDNGIYRTVFPGKANLADKSNFELSEELLVSFPNRWVVGKQVVGNDLLIDFIYFSNFYNANLQNVNFSNADLSRTFFLNANLTNANLTNANLTNANLTNANLTNAVLDGAILDGAILNCINHPICNS